MAEGEAAGLPDFRDREAAEAWLQTQPREVCLAIAARSSLRVVVAIGSSYEKTGRITLPVFRAICGAWAGVAARINVADVEPRTAEVAFYSAAYSPLGAVASVGASKADAAEYTGAYPSATAAAYSAAAAAEVAKFSSAAYSAAAAAVAFAADAAAFFAAAAATTAVAGADACALANGRSAETLARSILWPEGQPEWAREAWVALKSRLLDADEGWEVWTDWYEARLRGDAFDPELELARVLIPDAVWRQGPKEVNAEIARLIAEHREKLIRSLAQDSRGGRFVESAGRLTLAPGVSGFDPRADTMRPQVEAALDLLVERLGGNNQFGDLGSTATRLATLVALPSDTAAAHAFEMWSLSLSLAQWRARDDAAQARQDGFAEALDVETRRRLDDAVRVAAVFVRTFEEVQHFDAELAAFEGTVASPATQRAVLRAAEEADVLERASVNVVVNVVNAGEAVGAVAGRARAGGYYTMRNLVVAAAGIAATALVTGYLGDVGAGLARSHGASERADRFLRNAATDIDDLLRGAPPDLRHAIEITRPPMPPSRPPDPPQSP